MAGNVENFWWKRGLPNPMKGKKKDPSKKYKQTYANYHKAYYQTESGRSAKLRGQMKYRPRLSEKWGVGYRKAAQLEKAEREQKRMTQ